MVRRKKHPGGRPAARGTAADERITLRLTADERERWEQAAADKELGLGEFIRTAVEASLRRAR